MKTINKEKMDSFFQEAVEQLQEEHKDGNRKLNIYRLQDDGILVIIMDCYDMILDQELYENVYIRQPKEKAGVCRKINNHLGF